MIVLSLMCATSFRGEGTLGRARTEPTNPSGTRADIRLPPHDDGARPPATERRLAESPAVRAARERISALVDEAVAMKKLPGCVVVIGRHDRILLREAYGLRQIEPEPIAMTEDTVFDLASLTKPLATATSVMLLVERRALRIDDPVAKYVPEFATGDKASITIRDLLIHVSGLPADTPFDDYEHGQAVAIRRFAQVPLRAAPRTKFIYSDIGYIVLQAIIERTAGKRLDQFVRDEITEPLGMRETAFSLPEALLARVAPTEQRDGEWIRGAVHDPRAFRLGGIAGHAGLFSTAYDIARFAQAILGGGELSGRRILSARSVRRMTAPQDVPGGIRALGWDVSSSFSSNRGRSLSRLAVGHGGYTGTSLWIDPKKDLFVVFLSNRVHPDGKGAVNGLASQIGTIAGELTNAAEETIPAQAKDPHANETVVDFGIDVLEKTDFAELRGARIGLIANDSARDALGRRTIDVLRHARDLEVVKLFSPEHGLGANRDEKIADSVDQATGLPIHSLYGKVVAPTPEMLTGIDTIVFDLQDAGARFFTYASTLHAAMKVAAQHELRFVVLDRPNPINGEDVAGPVLRRNDATFVNHYPLPVRHGMTMGELGEMMNADDHLAARLEITPMRGWSRPSYYDQTGHTWTPPSPNLLSVDAAILYPGVALIEGTNVSVGRGTDRPFQLVGAPWIRGQALADALRNMGLEGVSIERASFRPKTAVHGNQLCEGVSFGLSDRSRVDPVRVGLALAVSLRRLYPNDWDARRLDDMVGNPEATSAILAGRSPAELEAVWGADLSAFRAKRLKYLLYGDEKTNPGPAK